MAAASAPDLVQPTPDGRRRGHTRWGGLLFLIHMIDALELPAEILADARLAARSLRWVLHRLALRLLPLAPSDAAALALAGLAPDADPPGKDEDPPGDAEVEALDSLARRLHAALVARLGREDGSERLVEQVCRRDAEVVADPGWIEVHLRLDQLTTEVRRVGLDLDPGYVRWLGVVVRFSYV